MSDLQGIADRVQIEALRGEATEDRGCTGQVQPGSHGGGNHMSFDTQAGTRGGRQPRTGLILRLVNQNAASRFRRNGKMLGFQGLILTTVGARSGAERTSPVGWWPGPDGSWLIVAAANGAARNPAWYH